MDARLAKYAAEATPRYTSYPTAPHFSDAVDGDVYRGWLERIDRTTPMSLYLHVPFCRQVCWYCGCNMKLASRYEPVAAYVETLLAEIDLVAGAGPAGALVSALAWGGGTPTALEPDDLERVMERTCSRFAVRPDAELAIEADPRTLTDAMIERIGRLGFTRASFGVQEFDPAVQAAINRIQPPEMVRYAVEAFRDVGLSSINFDLIYGLPLQTTETLLRTIDAALEMRPDRIALFGYAHVPWMAKKQRMIREADLPDGRARMEQARAAAARLAEAGYLAIGLDHFARPDDSMAVAWREGRLRRNFQGYTTDQADVMLGLGATAIGRTTDGYVQNVAETGGWTRAVQNGALPVAKGVAFQADDRLRGRLIETLMCYGEVDLAALALLPGAPRDGFAAELAALAPLAADGLLTIREGVVAMTEAGRPLVRVAAARFDRYLTARKAKHSVSV